MQVTINHKQRKLSFYFDISLHFEHSAWLIQRQELTFSSLTRGQNFTCNEQQNITSHRCKQRRQARWHVKLKLNLKDALSTISTIILGPHLLQRLQTPNETQASSTKQSAFYFSCTMPTSVLSSHLILIRVILFFFFLRVENVQGEVQSKQSTNNHCSQPQTSHEV